MKWFRQWLLKGLIKELKKEIGEYALAAREQIWNTERWSKAHIDYLDSEEALDKIVKRIKDKQL